MSSYSNFYNSYRYGKDDSSGKENLNNQYASSRQPIHPPRGYMEANYSWNNQGALAATSTSHNNQDLDSSRVYSAAGNGVYSHSQDYSSYSGGLSNSMNPYNQTTGPQGKSLESSGLNSLVYAPAIESTVHKDSNRPAYNTTRQDRKDSYQALSAPVSLNYSPQISNQAPDVAGRTTSGYNREPQRSPLSQPGPTPQHQNQPVSSGTARQQPAKAPETSQSYRQPSPRANSKARRQQFPNKRTPPTLHSLVNAASNISSVSHQSNGHNSLSTITTGSNAGNTLRPSTPPTMTNRYSNGQSGAGTEPISPPKVQFINPNELYNEQYVLAQERARAVEVEAAEVRRQQETEAQAQTDAATRAAEEAAADTTSAGPKQKPAKRKAPRKKAADKALAPEPDPLDGEDGMALEMRMMLEKLKGMRAKDPSLFSKLWDDFKKTPTESQQGSSSQENKGQKGQNSKSLITEPDSAAATTKTPGSARKNKGISLTGVIDGMPDLGKFPALRRRRKDKREDQQTPNKESSTTSVTQVNVNSMLNQPSDQPQHYTSDKLAAQDATWPAATQQKLAQAASEYLSKDPTNDKGQCSSDSLMLLLRNNPTYPDLCAQLESRGFVLDRQALARSLLAAVPALISNNTASQEPKNGEANGSMTSQQMQNSDPGAIESMALQATKLAPSSAEKAASKPQLKKNPAHPKSSRIENMPQLSTADVLFLDANGGSASMSIADLGTNASALPKNKPASLRKSLAQPIPPPVLGPKQEKARKRLFSEIVDLSLLSSDEDDEADEQEELSDEETGSRLSKQARIDHASIEHGGSSGFDQPSIDIGAPSPRPFESERSKSPTDSHMDEPEIDFNPDDEFCIRSIKAFKKIAKPIEPSAALERVYYNPKSVARDILITAGRHPSERPLNYHLIKFPDIFAGIGSKTDLGTFRWDLVDPGGPAMPVVELEDILAEPPRVPRKRRRDRQSRENTDKEGPASDAPHTELAPDSLSVTTTPLVRKTMTGTPTSGPGSGRRGRPPGSKNKNPTKATLKAAARSAQVAAPARLPIPDAPYPIFTCEWATCPAQLHDVHTLERHVDKAHVPGQTRCQWSRCPNSDTEYDGEDLKKHLHQAHVQALAWKYGDGPSVNGTDIQLDRYLNANGSIITPDANKAGESDSLIFPVEPTPIRAFNKLRGNDMPTQKAQEVLLAVRRRRKQVGIGLEQQGCEFSNPTRNKVFVNDEEVYQVVTDDEEDADDWFQQGDSS